MSEPRTFDVVVTLDNDDGIYFAKCDELGVLASGLTEKSAIEECKERMRARLFPPEPKTVKVTL